MYEIGALAALDDFFSAPRSDGSRVFSVNDFDVYVGTSAGSFLAATLAAGIPIRRLFRAILDDDRSMFPARRSDIYRFDVRQGLGILRDLSQRVDELSAALAKTPAARRSPRHPRKSN